MKGQTAIEYLMTYGWAILIILIVAGVLAYYGIFAPAGFLGPTARGFGTVAVLSPWNYDETGALTVIVENRAGQDITISSLIVDGTDYDLTDVAVNAGDTVTLGPTTVTDPGDSGEAYSITLSINYTIGTAIFRSTGTLSGTVS